MSRVVASHPMLPERYSMTKILTPKFRGSYVSVITPRRPRNGKGEAKFGATIVLPKDDPKTAKFIAALKADFKAQMIEKFGKVLPEASLKHWPIRDGDTYTDNEGNEKEEYAGCWFIGAKNTRQPGLVILNADGTKEELDAEGRALHADEFYSGAYYYASVTTYAWANEEGGKGVSVSLSGLMKAGDGERFGGGGYTSGDFDGTDEEAAPARPAAGKKRPAAPIGDEPEL